LLLFMTVGPSLQVLAQTDEEYFQTFPFNFSNPGARSSAMGGAFIGVADDASAAAANPAGLTNLTRRQLYLEYKNLYTPVAKLGGFDSVLTGSGTLDGPRVSLPGFINFAVPLNDHVTVAVSEHQFLSYKDHFDLEARRAISITDPLFPAMNADVNFSGLSFSGAVGLAVNRKLRLGLAGSINRLAASVDANRARVLAAGGVCETCAAIPSTEIHDSAFAFGFTGGALVQVNDQFSFGGVYAFEPRFTLAERVKPGQAYPGAARSDTSWSVPMNTPSRAGAGVAYRPSQRVLAVFDVDYVQYSQLVSNQQLVLFRHIESFTGSSGITADTSGRVADPSQFKIKDAADLHGGVEFNLVRGSNPVFVRYGVSRTAPHSVTYKTCPGDIHSPSFGSCDVVAQYYFSQNTGAVGIQGDPSRRVLLGHAETGVSIGAGVVVGRRTQIDGAFLTTSYRRQEFVLSSAIRF
jgi:hypothetical protein